MKIIKRTQNDVTLLDLDGNLALEGNLEFRKQITDTINTGTRKLIVNLAGVHYMDSCGLGELISGCRAMQGASGQFKLLNPNHRLRHLLVMTKLITVFETFDSESAAVESFST